MEAELKAGLIGAIAATTGSAFFLFIYENYKERRDRGRVASALLVELIAQAEFICVLSSAVNDQPLLPVRETFVRFLPTKPIMFDALAGQLPLLGARATSCVITCYGSIEWARSLVENLPSTLEYADATGGPHNAPTMPAFHSAAFAAELVGKQSQGLLERLKHAVGAAAYNAVHAIRDLDTLASHKRMLNDETIVADMLRKLQKAAE